MARLRRTAACAAVAAAMAVGLVVCPLAFSQNFPQIIPGYLKGTWPPISTSVTRINGWVVVQGWTEGNRSRIAWAVPLAPVGAGKGVTSERGIGTTYVTVGTQEFVVDNATGETHELRNGQIWRRFSPLTSAPAGTAAQQPPYTPGGPETTAPPPAPPGPAQQAFAGQQEALKNLMAANEQLAQGIDGLNGLRNDPRTTHADVMKAEQALADARAKTRHARQQVEDQLAATASHVHPPMPATAPAALSALATHSRQRQQINERILYVTGQMNRDNIFLQTLQQAKASPEEIQKVQAELATLNGELNAAKVALQKEEMTSSLTCAAINPQIRASLEQGETLVLDLTRKIMQAEQALAEIRANEAAGKATTGDVQAAMANLLALLQNRDAVRTELDGLCNRAESSTQPAAGAGGGSG